MKLGEILVRMGVFDDAQLKLALERQLVFGGHLGTSLFEMGLVDEETLGQALSRATGVPYAPRHFLANVEPEAIRAVPKKLAEAYQAVPIKVEHRSVHLAFVNPKDLTALDALRFATGRSVVAWIAPEVRVFRALEMYYGVARRARYARLDHRLDQPHLATPPAEYATPSPYIGSTGALSPSEYDATYGLGRPWQEVAHELFGGDAGEPDAPEALMSIPELAERYCRAESRDDLARAVLDFTAGRADRALLMFVRANQASVWEERGIRLSHGARGAVTFEVTSEPVFRLLMGNDYYFGALPQDQEILSFYSRLGMDAPVELLLIPIHVNDHLVAVAFIDGGPRGRIEGEVDEFIKAFRQFATAVLMVALRKNLRDGARPLTRVTEG
jgi:hypothetical protein